MKAFFFFCRGPLSCGLYKTLVSSIKTNCKQNRQHSRLWIIINAAIPGKFCKFLFWLLKNSFSVRNSSPKKDWKKAFSKQNVFQLHRSCYINWAQSLFSPLDFLRASAEKSGLFSHFTPSMTGYRESYAQALSVIAAEQVCKKKIHACISHLIHLFVFMISMKIHVKILHYVLFKSFVLNRKTNLPSVPEN